MSTYFVSSAEIDCGDVLEDKDIKGLYPLRVAWWGCAEGHYLLEFF